MSGWLTGLPVAHRGLHGPGRPENSLAAFRAAVDAGVAVELDVHALTAGGVAVFHDRSLERMCGVGGVIAAQDATALRRLRLAGTDEAVPTLAEALAVIGNAVPVYVELKQAVPAIGYLELSRRVAALLAGHPGPAAVLSFDPRPLAWFRRHGPAGIPRGQLGGSRRVPAAAAEAEALGLSRAQQWALGSLAVALVSRPDFVGYDVRALPHPAPALARRRMPLLAGIARTPTEVAVARRHADNVSFEDLDPALVLAPT